MASSLSVVSLCSGNIKGSAIMVYSVQLHLSAKCSISCRITRSPLLHPSFRNEVCPIRVEYQMRTLACRLPFIRELAPLDQSLQLVFHNIHNPVELF